MSTKHRAAVWLVILFDAVLVGLVATLLVGATTSKLVWIGAGLGIGLFCSNVVVLQRMGRTRRSMTMERGRLSAVWRAIGVIYGCGALYGIAMVLLGRLGWPYLGAIAFSGLIVWYAFRRASRYGQASRD